MASIGSITWKIDEESSYLKESDYAEFISSLGDVGKSLDSTKDSTDALIGSGGGLSAQALNFGGFSPLFEMGYNVSRNLSTASAAISELESVIKSDAKTHMTAEWGTHLQRANEHLKELEEAMNSAKTAYDDAHAKNTDKNPDNNVSNESDLEKKYNDAKTAYEDYKKQVERIAKTYEELAGEGAAAKVGEMDFSTVSAKSGGMNLEDCKSPNLTAEQEAWLDDHMETVMEVCEEYGILPSVLLGQMVYESVWGTSNVYNHSHNLFGIKWTEGCGYGNYSGFRVYDSDEESIRDYAKLLSTSQYYADYREGAKNWDYKQAVAGLKAYCPSDNYGDMVIYKINEFGFDKYDEVLKNGGAASIDLSKYKKLSAISKSNNAVNNKVNSKGIENVKDYHPTSGKVAEDAMAWAQQIADDNDYGYSQASRWGETKQFDCSSFVISAYKNAGIDVGGATYTGNMREELTKHGFEWIPGDPDVNDLQPGDIVLDEDSHTEMYIGNGKLIGAHDNYNGSTGDPSGEEIDVGNYYSHPWDGVLRYTGK